jgi:hypothetical protein
MTREGRWNGELTPRRRWPRLQRRYYARIAGVSQRSLLVSSLTQGELDFLREGVEARVRLGTSAPDALLSELRHYSVVCDHPGEHGARCGYCGQVTP